MTSLVKRLQEERCESFNSRKISPPSSPVAKGAKAESKQHKEDTYWRIRASYQKLNNSLLSREQLSMEPDQALDGAMMERLNQMIEEVDGLIDRQEDQR